MTKLHFLSSPNNEPLTKRFTMTDDRLEKHAYPQVAAFVSHEVEADTIEDFFAAMVAHANAGHCLLKGQLDRSLKNESRAGHTDSSTPTEWIVLDNDNLHDLKPQQLMGLLGLGDVDYILQYSASAGIEPGKRGYHLFVLLDRPWLPADLKRRLRVWNLDVSQIREHFQLSRTNNSLRWPLDISVCQNDKLIYIAPPTLGPGVVSTLEGDRIQLVKGCQRTATLTPTAETDELLRQRENTVLNQLRERAGLTVKTFETRSVKGEIVAKNPDQAQITGKKEERGFVYLNLNGGDSWGYYHPVAAPEVLLNFKSEANYLIAELLPDYYPEALARAKAAKAEQELDQQNADMARQTQRIHDAEANDKPFLQAFRDKKADQYYAGWIDPKNRTHNLNAISSKAKINELLVQHGFSKIDIVPSVDYRFEPSNDAIYDFEASFINRYTPSRYLKDALYREDAELPSTIGRVIQHTLGDDAEVCEHFLNWLAVLFRYRIRTQTAWILQGTTGTGKGLLFNEIIKPLIGEAYCRLVNLANLEDQFNAFVEETIVLFIDEVDTDQVKQMSKLMARFKTMITEDVFPLRAMRQNLRDVPNHLNLMLSSNQPNSMRIEANDRRFNVCPRQEQKLLAPDETGEELIARIKGELPAFADYLMSREADKAKARQALDNAPKRLLQTVTQTAVEEVALAFRHGDLSYFVDQRPSAEISGAHRSMAFDGRDVYIRPLYHNFIIEALKAAATNSKQVIQHDTLFAVFELLVGEMPKTKAKLAKRLGHQHLEIEPHTQGKTSVRGFGVQWQTRPGQIDEWQALIAQEEATARAGQLESNRAPRTKKSDGQDSADGRDQ